VSDLLTLDEAAQRVRLSPWAVRRAIRRGELDASKPAGRIRISEQAVEDWLKLTRIEADIERTDAHPLPALIPQPGTGDTFRARARRKAS